jgi:hypothetical protein
MRFSGLGWVLKKSGLNILKGALRLPDGSSLALMLAERALVEK